MSTAKKKTVLEYVQRYSRTVPINKVSDGAVKRMKSSTVLNRHGTLIQASTFGLQQAGEYRDCTLFDDDTSPTAAFQVPEGAVVSAEIKRMRNGMAEVDHVVKAGDKTTQTRLYIQNTRLAQFQTASQEKLRKESVAHKAKKPVSKEKPPQNLVGCAMYLAGIFQATVYENNDVLQVSAHHIRTMKDMHKPVNGTYSLRAMIQLGLLAKAEVDTIYRVSATGNTFETWRRAAFSEDPTKDEQFMRLVESVVTKSTEIRHDYEGSKNKTGTTDNTTTNKSAKARVLELISKHEALLAEMRKIADEL